MNAERLLAHLETISEAPDAVARLRRFILDLAVRGKLVEQDPGDEPAEELFCRYLERRMDLVSQAKIRRPKPSSPIRDEETPIVLPGGWTWARLNQIGNLSGGMTPSMGRPDYWNGEITWLSPKDIKSDEVFESELMLSELGLSEGRLELYPPGCLFIVARSGILKRTLPVAINRVSAAANQDMKVLVPFVGGQERYLQIMLKGLTGFILKSLVKTGTTVQSLKYGEFAEQPFPIPPLAEQHRIVAKVDELMALCDRLEASRQQREQQRERLVAASLQRLSQPSEDPATARSDARFALQVLPSLTTTSAQIKQLRQTILNLAVRGKLVEQDPGDEPAEELLRCISKHKKTSPVTANGDSPFPFALPIGWVHTTLRTLVESSNSGWSPKTLDRPREGNEWGILKVSAVSWDYFRPEANKQVLPGTQPKPQAVIRKGDFLISRANTAELVARAVIVASEPVKLMMSDKIVRLELVELCESKYVLINNNHSSFSRGYYAERATGVSPSMKNVTRDVILDLPIPLPPLAEQHRIVAKVDELMALCDQLEQQLSQADQQRRRLLEAVLAEALRQPEAALEGMPA